MIVMQSLVIEIFKVKSTVPNPSFMYDIYRETGNKVGCGLGSGILRELSIEIKEFDSPLILKIKDSKCMLYNSCRTH